MTRFFRVLTLPIALAAIGPAVALADYDLVVYGGSSAGIAAAVQVKKMGGSVVVIEPSDRIGGLSTGGLGQTDIGNKQVIGGVSRDFYRGIKQWYDRPEAWTAMEKPADGVIGSGQSRTEANEDTLWTFEPSAALAVFQQWVKQHDIEVVYGERLNRTGEGKATDRGDGFHVAQPGTVATGVVKDGNRITAIVMESGRRFEGKAFMDATYEGDLMAAAGVAFTVGREGRAIYNEELNGVQMKRSVNHQLADGIDPYVKPGDPSSGLLAGIDPTGPGDEYASDGRIQAYCFRMCLTDHEPNRIPFAKPAGYDEAWYELLFRNFEAGFDGLPMHNSRMPNRKTDTNNRYGVSTDFIGQNYGWPQGTYAERDEIRKKHLVYQQGLMWALANHPRVPQQIRDEVSKWGMTKDEFTEGGGWQQQLYVREGRRMISDVVMTQAHCQRGEIVDDPVGMGAYNMDSHNTQRYVTPDGKARNEGNVEVKVRPYSISYRSIIPRQQEASNLTVPVALSSSHIAFGSIRMEPVFMILGQSAATASMLAQKDGVALQELDYAKLRARLLADDQVLEYTPPVKNPASKMKGIVVDDTQALLDGHWNGGAFTSAVNDNYHHDHGGTGGLSTATYKLPVDEAGRYAVQVSAVPNENRSTNTLVLVDGQEFRLNQQRRTGLVDDRWSPVTHIDAKASSTVTVVISNQGTTGHVIADAVRLLRAE